MKGLIALGAVTLALAGAAPAIGAENRYCGIAHYSAKRGTNRVVGEDKVYVIRGKLSCAGARVLDHYADIGYRIKGFRCRFTSGETITICVSRSVTVKGIAYSPPPPPPIPPPPINNPAISISTDLAEDDLIIDLASSTFCQSDGTPDAVTVTVSEGHEIAAASTETTSTCNQVLGASWSPDPAFSTSDDFDLTPDYGNYNDMPLDPALDVNPNYVSGTHHLVYRVSDEQGAIAQGLFTVATTPAQQVFEGTDAFVNYCIDQDQTVYSQSGRLYCEMPTSYYVTLGWN